MATDYKNNQKDNIDLWLETIESVPMLMKIDLLIEKESKLREEGKQEDADKVLGEMTKIILGREEKQEEKKSNKILDALSTLKSKIKAPFVKEDSKEAQSTGINLSNLSEGMKSALYANIQNVDNVSDKQLKCILAVCEVNKLAKGLESYTSKSYEEILTKICDLISQNKVETAFGLLSKTRDCVKADYKRVENWVSEKDYNPFLMTKELGEINDLFDSLQYKAAFLKIRELESNMITEANIMCNILKIQILGANEQVDQTKNPKIHCNECYNRFSALINNSRNIKVGNQRLRDYSRCLAPIKSHIDQGQYERANKEMITVVTELSKECLTIVKNVIAKVDEQVRAEYKKHSSTLGDNPDQTVQDGPKPIEE